MFNRAFTDLDAMYAQEREPDISPSESLHANCIQPGASERMQNHLRCIILTQTLPLDDGERSPPLHFPYKSLRTNCSVLLLTVALGSSQILALGRIYHKGQKRGENCACVCA